MSQAQLQSPARPDFFSLARWGYFLAAAVLAGCSAAGVYRFTAFQSYSELIVGAISWAYATKTNDYALLFSFVGLFFVFLLLLSRLAARIEATWEGGEVAFHDFVVLLCVPAGVWLAGLLTTRSLDLRLLKLSGALLVVNLALTAIRAFRRGARDDASPFAFAQKATVFLFLCVLAFAAVAVGIERLGAAAGGAFWLSSQAVHTATLAVLAVASSAVFAAAVAMRSVVAAERMLERGILALQVVLPAGFLVLVPQPWNVQGHLVPGFPMTAWGWVFVGLCVLGAYVDLVRHVRGLRGVSPRTAVALLSVGSLVAILLLLKCEPTGAPAVWTDDYHSGELLVPWWSLVHHHVLPFIDYTPARGLVNYVFGGLLDLLFDGKASSLNAVQPFLYAALVWLAMPLLGRTAGRGVAFLGLLLFPYMNGISDIDVVVTAVLCLLWAGFGAWKPAAWLCAWVVVGTLLVLFAPGQGALATVAMGPLGAVMAYRVAKGETVGWKVAVAVLVALLLATLLTPLGPMVLGAVRYGLEQSSINSIAHGIQWAEGFGKTPASPWLYELMRTSWLLAALWAGILLWRAFRQDSTEWRRKVLLHAVPVLLLCVLFIIRAAGRIDADGSISRLGLASIWGIALLLPVLIFGIGPVRHPGVTLFVWLGLAGVVSAGIGSGLPASYAGQFDPLPDPRSGPEWVAAAPLPQLGSGLMDPVQIERLRVLRKVLDTVLGPNETYLDLSGRHATYFYFGRRPPIESGSVYNLVTEGQQLRSIAALRRSPPPLVLIQANNYLHDGGPISLRAPLMYRFLLLSGRYKVAQIGPYVWLVDAARLDRLATLDVKSVSDVNENADSPLRAVFAVGDLAGVPASWGRSHATLEKRLTVVAKVSQREPLGSNSVVPESSGNFRVTGPDPYVRYDLSALNLAGRQAGILGFDFQCDAVPGGPPPVIEIYWASSANPESELTVTRLAGIPGRLLVPLDAYPAWLLASRLQTIRFDVRAAESCRSYGVRNITLYQRSAAVGLGGGAAKAGFGGA